MGTARGSVIFVSVKEITKIYARISFHRDQITMIESIFCKAIQSYLLISCCSEKKMKVKKI
jgi:rRNA processing protein Gar1